MPKFISGNKPVRSQTSEMIIGNTTYIVTTTFNENSQETAEQKLLRVASNRISDETKCGKVL